MNPRWPIYIPSKGRAESRLTMKMFDSLGVPYTVFVEPQEADAYAAALPPNRLHVLPHRDQGVTVTRNYIWDLAEREGHEWHWVFDDNIKWLYRYNNNLKTPVADGTVLAVIENFVERYENIAIAGMHYFMFVLRKYWQPPFVANTRIYSNMLTRTLAKDETGKPFRYETFFNEDTDLSLRVLKAGWCTVLFNAFLIEKTTTMYMKGGNTEFYEKTEKRLEFVEELRRRHPESVQLIERWHRWHHYVDYSRFRQPLRRKPGLEIPQGVDNFGMVLQERDVKTGEWKNPPEEQQEESKLEEGPEGERAA